MVETVVSVTLREIFTSLIFNRIMRYYDITNKVPILPGKSTTIRFTVPKGMVLIVAQAVVVVSKNGVLSAKLTVDGELRGYDPDAVQQTYSYPTTWFDLGALVPVEKEWAMEIASTSTEIEYVWITTRYGIMPKKYFDEIVKRHFEAILVGESYEGD